MTSAMRAGSLTSPSRCPTTSLVAYMFPLGRCVWVDHVPFFVRPPRGRRTAEIAYLMPTFTYLAYSDERMLWADNINYADLTDRTIDPSDPDITVREHPEWGSSMYDFHRDGTGVCFASRRRPVPNMRPDYRFWLTGHHATLRLTFINRLARGVGLRLRRPHR